MYKRALRTGIALAAGAGLAVGAGSAVGTSSAVGATAPGPGPEKAGPAPARSGAYRATTVLAGASLSHPVGAGTEPLTEPDDIVSSNGRLFVAFQNGVGATGGPSSSGNPDSTLVELTPAGAVVGRWDLAGKIDGLGADPAAHRVIATVNEDGASSLYTVTPGAAAPVVHYTYTRGSVTHGGGTDAVSVYHGRILISASAPTVAAGPAVYAAALDARHATAALSPVFYDDSTATSATTGAPTTLALTDPDSNAVVPGSSPRYPGDFVLDSQGDQQQVFVHDAGGPAQHLSVLGLSTSVDDTAWATGPAGVLYVTDAAHDTVDAVTGPFRAGQALVVATPCDANTAPAGCAPSYLGGLDLADGTVTPLDITGAAVVPHAAVFVAGGDR